MHNILKLEKIDKYRHSQIFKVIKDIFKNSAVNSIYVKIKIIHLTDHWKTEKDFI